MAFPRSLRTVRHLVLMALLLLAGGLPAAGQEAPSPAPPVFTGQPHAPFQSSFDQEHLRLALRFQPDEGRVLGEARLRLRPLAGAPDSLVLWAAGLHIDSLHVGFEHGPTAAASYRTGAADSLVISLAALDTLRDGAAPPSSAPLASTAPFTVRIYYRAQPRKGLYFVRSGAGDPAGALQIWSQGAPEDNRHWFPVIDHPSDKLTSELLVTVAPPLEVLSNGRLLARTEAPDGVTFHYAQRTAHAPYLITLAAGDYAVVPDSVRLPDGRLLPLSYWVYPGRTADAARTFGRTPEMVRFFSTWLNYPYPWEAYRQVVVKDFHFGGMENTTATTMTDRLLLDARAVLDHDPDGLVAHELAHHWFGNLVTAADWPHIWLNEGFATYMDALFTEHAGGREAFALKMNTFRDRYLAEAARYRRPLVWDEWEHPIDLFDAHSYQKGAWVLHMLRRQAGDKAFRDALELYLKSHPYGSVDTEDFRMALEAVTEHDLNPFFEQWVYGAGHPVLEVSHRYDAAAERLLVDVAQVQEGPLVAAVFRLPLTLEVHTLAEATRHEVLLDARRETFTLPLAMPPRFVTVDPEEALLAGFKVTQSAAAWVAQLRYAPEPVSRIAAARALQGFAEDPALFVGLRNALQAEEVAPVRVEILRTLRSLSRSPAAERLLIERYTDPDADVREAVLTGLAAYAGSTEAAALALRAAQNDPSYEVQAAAVRALVPLGATEAGAVVRSALVTPSHDEVIRSAAFAVLPEIEMPPRESLDLGLRYSAASEPTALRVAALRYLGTRAHNNPPALARLREALAAPSVPIRAAAIEALARVDTAAARAALTERLPEEPQPLLRYRLQWALQP